MLVRWISDLHLGDKSSADDFYHGYPGQERHLIDFIADTYANGGLLIIAGDLLDNWQASLFSITHAYRKIFTLLAQGDHVIIEGNHDSHLPILTGVLPLRYSYEEGDILTLHGHQFDRYNKPNAISGRVITWLVGKLERRFPDIDKNLEHLREYVHPSKSDVDYAYECAELGRRNEVKVVVYGHTHKIGALTMEGIKVVNAGTWVRGNRDYLEYDGDEIKLKMWAQDGRRER